MTAVLARRLVMAGGVWVVGVAGSIAVLDFCGARGWSGAVAGFAMGHVTWTATRRVWRWSKDA